MTEYNLTAIDIVAAYEAGLLPQRTQKGLFYRDVSSRSNLKNFKLSSENRRIIKKTSDFSYKTIPLNGFKYSPAIQKQIHNWVKALNWDFPTSTIRTVFTNHIFNFVDIWSDSKNRVIAYLICFTSAGISHAAYLFYDPAVSHQDILIRIVLQHVIDSHDRNLNYTYLGRFSRDTGFYKRNMPGFEYFNNGRWQTL